MTKEFAEAAARNGVIYMNSRTRDSIIALPIFSKLRFLLRHTTLAYHGIEVRVDDNLKDGELVTIDKKVLEIEV